MSLILHIDTSTEHASICVAEGETTRSLLFNHQQKDHAAWLHPAIQEALKAAGGSIGDLGAVGITAGPGSYTGLRVAMASAKGLCYALEIPLIAVNTLEAMVYAALQEDTEAFCPAIDARRMEIFTAVYDRQLQPLLAPQNMLVEATSFDALLDTRRILFFGNGSAKMEAIIRHPHAQFRDVPFNASHLAIPVWKRFQQGDFTPLALSEPLYLKEFYTTAKPVKQG